MLVLVLGQVSWPCLSNEAQISRSTGPEESNEPSPGSILEVEVGIGIEGAPADADGNAPSSEAVVEIPRAL